MDNNASSTNPIGPAAPAATPSSTPTPNTNQASTDTAPAQSSNDTASDKPRRLSPVVIGAVGAVAGLVIGAVCAYGITKLNETPPTTCPECKCPTLKAASGDLDYGFLKLEPQNSNIVYSPLSIRNGLALLDAGSSGTTKTEIDKVLGDTEIPKYQNNNELSLANAVFIRDNFKNKVLASYTDLIQNQYDGEVVYDSFQSSNNMDEWVSKKTLNLINSIGIQPNPDLRMVLANALAIQMDWKYRFDTDDTVGRTFYQQDGAEIEATTLKEQFYAEDVKYYKANNIQAITMPLGQSDDNTDLEFTAIMPPGNLSEYVSNVSATDIDDIINNSIPASEPKRGVVAYIPKFKFDYELNFKGDLMSMGIQTAFNEKTADFSKMASDPLYVGAAVHKANIDFSEEGIKAAAVTVFAMNEMTAIAEEPESSVQPIFIEIDHPFLFVIRDKESGAILFTGTVYEPNLWADDEASYQPTY